MALGSDTRQVEFQFPDRSARVPVTLLFGRMYDLSEQEKTIGQVEIALETFKRYDLTLYDAGGTEMRAVSNLSRALRGNVDMWDPEIVIKGTLDGRLVERFYYSVQEPDPRRAGGRNFSVINVADFENRTYRSVSPGLYRTVTWESGPGGKPKLVAVGFEILSEKMLAEEAKKTEPFPVKKVLKWVAEGEVKEQWRKVQDFMGYASAPLRMSQGGPTTFSLRSLASEG